MVDTAHTAMTYGRVLYENLLRASDAVFTFNGTTTPGQPPRNAYDWQDFTLFQIAGSETASLDVLFSSEVTFDTFAFYAEEGEVVPTAVTLQVETGVGTDTYSDVDTFDVTNQEFIFMRELAEQTVAGGAKVRFKFETSPDGMGIRQIAIGSRLEFPMGQHEGITPPNLTYGVAVSNTIAVNGSIIGRSFRRLDRTTQIDLEYLEPTWVRTSWEPFARHAARFAFFYQWDPGSYSDEVVFAAAREINPPRNSAPGGKMSVTMPIHCLSDELTQIDTSVCSFVSSGVLPDDVSCSLLSGGQVGDLVI